MEIRTVVKNDTYYDSVTLMIVSGKVTSLEGVLEAVVVMATPLNKELLENVGMLTEAAQEAKPDDLIIAIKAKDADVCDEALQCAEEAMRKKAEDRTKEGGLSPSSIGSAVTMMPEANLAIISVPGAYAAREAMQALKKGLHVMMFSDNVSLADELALKEYAHDNGLLMMGPDCGTVIINNRGLCFANAVNPGNIGIVGASGTGIQEVSVLIDRFGGGVSQVLGTGGRDLYEEIGGIMMLDCLEALACDEETKVIVLISKPPAKSVAQKILVEVQKVDKRVVVCFINGDATEVEKAGAHFAKSLEEAAYKAVLLAHGKEEMALPEEEVLLGLAAPGVSKLQPGQKYVRGLFCGGTLCDEALHILEEKVGMVYSNISKKVETKLENPHVSKENTLIDLGDDAFTVGRPHPMIDPSLRLQRILEEAKDPEAAVILLDIVLGYGSHQDPAGITLPAILQAKQIAENEGRHIEFVAYVCGTDKDPQNRSEQIEKLTSAGVVCAESNVKAAHLAAAILSSLGGNRMNKINNLFKSNLGVANVGAQTFSEELAQQDTQVVNIDWRPPAGGNEALIHALESLDREEVNAANAKAMEIIFSARPVLVDIRPAIEVIPRMTKTTILHAGPPITWDKMAKVMKGSIIGALLFEGLANDVDEAIELAASGAITFSPCHEHDAVGPMAGIISPSMAVQVVENKTHGNFAYCAMNEGLGKVLRYGVYTQEVIDRLKWMASELAPVLSAAVKLAGGLDIRQLIAHSLHMGDEAHNRNKAGSMHFVREMSRWIVRTDFPKETITRVLDFISVQDHWSLYLTMPACKTMQDAAYGIENCTLVSALARNGVELGLRISGLPGQWFTGPAQMITGLLFPGFTMDDANPDMGDSSIAETTGLGAFAMGGAPAMIQFVGGTVDDAIGYTLKMREIATEENPNWTMPNLNFRGTPTGIDVRKVVQTGIVPNITTGIAHKEPGMGQIGAGVTTAPMEAFEKALLALSEKYGEK